MKCNCLVEINSIQFNSIQGFSEAFSMSLSLLPSLPLGFHWIHSPISMDDNSLQPTDWDWDYSSYPTVHSVMVHNQKEPSTLILSTQFIWIIWSTGLSSCLAHKALAMYIQPVQPAGDSPGFTDALSTAADADATPAQNIFPG